MEVFQAIGIIVVALLFYAVYSLFIVGIVTGRKCDTDELWVIAWVLGGIGFAIVSYCWITGVPLPVLK